MADPSMATVAEIREHIIHDPIAGASRLSEHLAQRPKWLATRNEVDLKRAELANLLRDIDRFGRAESEAIRYNRIIFFFLRVCLELESQESSDVEGHERNRATNGEESQAKIKSAGATTLNLEILDMRSAHIGILFLSANPFRTNRLRLDEEVRTIDERLQMAQFRDRFELRQVWAVRTSDLSQALLRYTPHIVHFSGHGSDKGEIILENQVGDAKRVSSQALSRLFRTLKDNIRCVVLNACFSSIQAEAIVKEIDCVVGMSSAIGDEAAVRFAGGFYRALGFGRSIQTAFDLGLAEIDIDSLGEEDTPKLLVKQGVDPTKIAFTS